MVKQLLTRISFIGLTSILLITPFSTKDSYAQFTDVTSTAGLGNVGPSYGNPVWSDFNNDGNLDLTIPRHRATPSLYQNDGAGQFSDIFTSSGITPLSGDDRHGWAWGDYNNDGNIDLFISNGGCRGSCVGSTRDQLWKGNGQGYFVNVTAVAGIDDRYGRGRNAFWVDYNNDRFLDLFVLNTKTNSILYRNNGNGTFKNVTTETGLSNTRGENCSWADYNHDGTMDLLITGGGGNDRLFRNRPVSYKFSDVTAEAGLIPKRGTGITWGDYNNDGYLDLYIARGNDYITNSLVWSQSKIIFGDEERWDDGIDFTTTGSNVTFKLYIKNKYQPGMVFIGSGKTNPLSIPFTLSASDSLVEGIPSYTSGTDTGFFIWKDASGVWHLRYSGDGNFPTYYGTLTSNGSFTMVTSTFNPVSSKYKDTLYQNNGDGTFTDVTDLARVGKRGNHHVALWGDYDNDGFLDLYVVENGDVTGGKPSLLYKNRGDGTFVDVAINQGVDAVAVPGRKYGAAWGDYNNDGFIDLFVKNGLRSYYPNGMGSDILYRNSINSNHWLKVNLIGTWSNRRGIGAKLTASINGMIQYREVNGGGGGELRSQGSGPVHFGIGPATAVDSLIIKWPSGRIQTLTNIPADQTVTITEN